ncbi:CYFA0S04e06898g1_1 [Cyberlindnera fabianii]|uniref:CYFA0S04e06898g1_1 n=1 Tax=Cyberlindnera fabianii TaxID=36022 RepID=A0A061AZT3_CYBFA|nr:Protein phosphatase type 2A regulatory subunit RTS3 [Cyberlindnera fabianii]CDR40264.1 CYFA0S04e06898g1_1 [Cyberlindnera fabianii]
MSSVKKGSPQTPVDMISPKSGSLLLDVPLPVPGAQPTTREGRSHSIAQPISASSSAAKHRMSVSRSPIRGPGQVPQLSQSQRLRQPLATAGNHNHRRSSLAAIDTSDMSSTLGMPYAYHHSAPTISTTTVNGFVSDNSLSPSSTGSSFTTMGSIGTTPRPAVLNSTVPTSNTRVSPRSSHQSLDTNSTSHSAQLRRHSESSNRRPSTAEVFDLMEREQDAIVLKLMREIQQLKDDNRALLQTINMLTNPSSAASSARSSLSTGTGLSAMSRSRRASNVVPPEIETLDLSSGTPRRSLDQTPRSMRSIDGDLRCLSPQEEHAGLRKKSKDDVQRALAVDAGHQGQGKVKGVRRA